MARASIETLLPLDKFAQILGITPPHFNGGAAVSLSPAVFPLKGNCEQLWWQYPWQAYDRVSREDLARAIAEAEDEVARLVGFYPAPKWISKEIHQWTLPHRPDAWNITMENARGANQHIETNFKKIISPGRRATSEIDTDVAVVYSDPDGDGYSEIATITINNVTLTDVCEAKVYFAGKSADPAWEIRPAKTKTLVAGTLTITFYSWLLIDPDLWEAFPTDETPSAIDISTTDNFVAEVDVYREYNDTTQASAELYWENDWQPLPFAAGTVCVQCGGTGCVACQLTYQTGCFHIRDVNRGLVVPYPATYSETDGAWAVATATIQRAPDQVKLWYYAGDLSEKYLAGNSCEQMSDEWANIISYIAVARLERPLCACGNAAAMAEWLREDLAIAQSAAGGVRLTGERMLDNPLGTRRGEMMAWRKIKNIRGLELGVATL